MTKPLHLKILAPQGLIIDEEVLALQVPMANGEVGILPGHIKYLGLLGVGICEFTKASSKEKVKLILVRGFINFKNNQVNIQSDQVYFATDSQLSELLSDEKELSKIMLANHINDPKAIYANDRLTLNRAVKQLAN